MNKVQTYQELLDYQKRARFVLQKLHKEIEELKEINKYLQSKIEKLEKK